MNSSSTLFSAIVCAALSLAVAGPSPSEANFMKVRCSLDPSESVFYSWHGDIYTYFPQSPPTLTFGVVGYNVARCVPQADGSYKLLTRELSYYLDPSTRERIDVWANPFVAGSPQTAVVHVANDPVNAGVGDLSVDLLSPTKGALVVDVPLFYPNPLHQNGTAFASYGGDRPYYEAGEFFKFYFDVADLEASPLRVDDVAISWTRVGPFLPWMAMGEGREGGVLYSCAGARALTPDIEAANLPEWLVKDVRERLPKYLEAPTEFETPNETSNSYFIKHFDEFVSGEVFPLADDYVKV